MSGHIHDLAALPLGKGPPGTHSIGGWLGLRAGLDVVAQRKKFLPLPGIKPLLSSP